MAQSLFAALLPFPKSLVGVWLGCPTWPWMAGYVWMHLEPFRATPKEVADPNPRQKKILFSRGLRPLLQYWELGVVHVSLRPVPPGLSRLICICSKLHLVPPFWGSEFPSQGNVAPLSHRYVCMYVLGQRGLTWGTGCFLSPSHIFFWATSCRALNSLSLLFVHAPPVINAPEGTKGHPNPILCS